MPFPRSAAAIGRRLLTAVLLALLVAPAHAQEWFDDYTRGVDALRRGRAGQAAELLQRAVRKRPEPGENVLTYGTNRIDRYYPYLHLAEALIQLERWDAAREALRRSEQYGREPAPQRLLLAGRLMKQARAAEATPPPTPPPTPRPTPVPTAPPTAAPATPPPAPPATAPAATPVPARTGLLVVESEPPGATVLVEGQPVGRTPLLRQMPPGEYSVTLRREGWADDTFVTRIEAGARAREARRLMASSGEAPAPVEASPRPPVDEPAGLIVFSDPPGATVYVDDEPLGATDPGTGRLVKSGLAPGRHRVRLSAAGRQDFVAEVELGSGALETVRGTLVAAPVARTGRNLGLALLLVLVAAVALYAWRRRQASPTDDATMALPAGAAGPDRTPAARTPTPARRPVTPRPTMRPAATPPDPGADPATLSQLTTPPGEPFGTYTLLDQLGRGGMAAVFRAERNGEHCALKRPLPGLLDDEEFIERFLREAEIGRTLHHPNIIRILDRGDVDGTPFFTMELVDGETLQAYVKERGALAPKEATRIVAQVAEALDYAHLKGVVHRDLKPSNIMVLADGTVKVMDYGIARARRFDGLTVTGAFLGTPDYVAPETAEGRGTDARSDLYALGVVYYEILTGQRPFVGETPFATLRKHCTEPPTPPSIVAPGTPREIEAIILKLLAKDPDDRYPGAEELLLDLRDYLNR